MSSQPSPANPPQATPVQALVIGAGPAGLSAAERLAEAGVNVAIRDRMPTPARKFLMAGRGGLNLTHSEPLEAFLGRYGEARDRLAPAIAAYPPQQLTDWCEGLGQKVFEGTSGRIFPVAMKASPLLRAWLARLDASGVTLAGRSAWTGWDSAGAALFDTPRGVEAVSAPVTLLALGGASWPRLGGDGGWSAILEQAGVPVAPFAPANCGFRIPWSARFLEACAGAPLKPLALSVAGGPTVRGEAVITREGLEGGAVYALSAAARREADRTGRVVFTADLHPDITLDQLAARLARAPASTTSSRRLEKAGLPRTAIALMNELHAGRPPREPQALARAIKAAQIVSAGPIGLDRAISSAGGVRWDALAPDFSLKARPDVFVAGEMIDWEAPTGGYLLQACFATGRAAAAGMLARLGLRDAA